MKTRHEEILNDIYNLILNPATRKWERSLLIAAKNGLENGEDFGAQIGKLEFDFRPLASRNNLTPDVADFYEKITSNQAAAVHFDIAEHSADELPHQERAVFAGGCFWCMVEPFETKKGVVSVLSGYTGGHTNNPTYEQVLGGYTGHVEAVEIIFDTRVMSYEDLVELYWKLTDPTDEFGQIADRGNNYRPIIFVRNAEQRKIAERSKKRLVESGKYKRPIVTTIETAGVFWPAENYHQQFYKKNRKRYKSIKRTRQQYLAFQKFKGKIRSSLRWIKKKN